MPGVAQESTLIQVLNQVLVGATESAVDLLNQHAESVIVLEAKSNTHAESAIVLLSGIESAVDSLEGFTDGIEGSLTIMNVHAESAIVIESSIKMSVESAVDILNEKLDITLSALRSSLTFADFGSAINLGMNINDAFTFDNVGGFSSISFRVVPPTGGTIVFEGTPDGVTWDISPMRSTNINEYIQKTNVTDIVIGSISALRKFRVRTIVAGTVAGSVIGRAQRDASTLESTEFSNRPDKIGAQLITMSAQFTTAQTNKILWTPAPGKIIYVTSYKVAASGTTDGTVTIFDETNTPDSWISPPVLYDVSVNNGIIDHESFSIPLKLRAINNSVKITSSANINISVTVRGYEAL